MQLEIALKIPDSIDISQKGYDFRVFALYTEDASAPFDYSELLANFRPSEMSDADFNAIVQCRKHQTINEGFYIGRSVTEQSGTIGKNGIRNRPTSRAKIATFYTLFNCPVFACHCIMPK